MDIKLAIARCSKCNKTWHPQTERPIRCRWCGSYHWDDEERLYKPRHSFINKPSPIKAKVKLDVD